jgi:hypothetical protein
MIQSNGIGAMSCVIREVTEELRLTGEQFAVSREPLTRLEYTAFSHSAGQQTQYTMELFEVELTGPARRRVEAEPNNRWLTEQDIQGQRTPDGTPVSPTMSLLLRQAGLLANA